MEGKEFLRSVESVIFSHRWFDFPSLGQTTSNILLNTSDIANHNQISRQKLCRLVSCVGNLQGSRQSGKGSRMQKLTAMSALRYIFALKIMTKAWNLFPTWTINWIETNIFLLPSTLLPSRIFGSEMRIASGNNVFEFFLTWKISFAVNKRCFYQNTL